MRSIHDPDSIYFNTPDKISSDKFFKLFGDPDGMREITYPHIRLSPQIGCNNFEAYKELVGFPIDYKISELIKTKHTYSHRVFMNEEERIIARIVLKENPPFISKKEMDGLDGTQYNRYTGYPVIM